MDGIIGPIEARLKRIELHLFGPAADDSGHTLDTNPAQTLPPSRMPLTPGAPIGNYDPTIAQDDETDAAIAAETEWKSAPKPAFIPEVLDDDPTLNPPAEDDPTLNADGTTRRRRRATVDGDVT